MNIRDAADSLKATLTAEDVVQMYGYTPRHGVIVCPFHGDRDASLHLYPADRGWCCFGCHAGGTVIDWVMRMEDVGFAEAVRILDARAGTGLLDRVDLDEGRHRQRRAKLDAVKKSLLQAWDTVQHYAEQEITVLTRASQEYASIPGELLSGRDYMTWGSINERMEELEDLIREAYHNREEVRTWRPTPQPATQPATQPTGQETRPSSPARPSTPSPALSRMRDKITAAQNRLAARG